MQGLLDFLSKNSIYIVLSIVLIVWVGIFSFLMVLDRRLKYIESEVSKEKKERNS